MSLLEHLKEAARHLKEATQMASDFRVKEAAVSAGTIVNCAVHIQEKIMAGKVKVEVRPAHGEKVEGGNREA